MTNNINDYDKLLYETRAYSTKEFDKQIVYLSSGALIFTTGFVKQFLDINQNTDKCLLIASWIFFTLSLILNLISHLTSIKSIDEDLQNGNYSNLYNKITGFLNIFSVISLGLGIMCFLIFSIKTI